MQNLNHTITPDRIQRPIKIMQFGGGNFMRGFVDWLIHILNQETNFNGGIAVIKPTSGGDYAELKAQDGLFTVVLDGIKNGKLISERTLVTEVQEIIHSYNEWERYLKLAENEDLRFIFSNTTEAGIKFNIEDNFEDCPPKEFAAKLTLWLYHRFNYFKGDPLKGCILLPCELINDNAYVLREVILQYADHWKLDKAFVTWINTANHFCCTLVDRIVSGYPADRANDINKDLNYKDDLLVAGEYYHSWVIKAGEMVQKELPFLQTDLNVTFVNDLAPYRKMKVRILNGAHTSMVPVGYLAGIRFVKEAMDHEEVGKFVETLLREEVAKTLDFPEETKNKFIADVLDRFRNPLLKHKLMSISLNSTAKFVSRLLPTLKEYYQTQGELPKRIVFGLSALLRFYKGDFNGKIILLNDDRPVLNSFASEWEKAENDSNMMKFANNILSNTTIWGEDLTQIKGLTESVATNIENIEKNGIAFCLTKI